MAGHPPPDGRSIPVEQFTAGVGPHTPANLLLSERNLPYSLDAFKQLPAGVNIHIKTRAGNNFSLARSSSGTKLVDKNISVNVADMPALKTTIWQLQRPVTSPKMRLVQLAADPDIALPTQSYGSKIPVDNVGTSQLLNAITSMRQQSLVISARIENGFLVKDKQRIAIADLEKVAAERDVSLIILGSDKPKKTLQQLAKDWQQRQTSGKLLMYSAGDFYNAFAPKSTASPISIEMNASGQLRTALRFEQAAQANMVQPQAVDIDLALLPLHVLARSATIFRPSEVRAEELEDRIHPLVPSWVHIALLASFLIGVFTVHASWFLYQKLWASPQRANSKNCFFFTLLYILHRSAFLLIYLPLLGFISPLYLLVKWTCQLIHFLLIRPTLWLFKKLS